MKLYGCRPPI